MGYDLHSPWGGGGIGTPPSRDQLLGGICRFQGVFTNTQQYGRMPSGFTVAIPWLQNEADRLACYADLRAAGSQVVVMAVSGQYHSPDASNWFNRMPGQDYFSTGQMNVLHDRIVEAVTKGGMTGVELWCGGDGKDFDPSGLTHGYQWLMDNFAAIYAALKDVAPWIIWQAGADGCIPGWDWDNDGGWTRQETWFSHARSVIGPSGHLGAYLSAGYWCWTEANRWLSTGGRRSG